MSSNNNNNNDNDNERESENESKNEKKKKVIKFQLPEAHSEESFSSALSLNVEENESEEYIEPIMVPVLRKFTTTTLRRSCPRVASTKPCFQELSVYEDLESASLIKLVSSSKQLVDIMKKNSPTHSEANFNLLNSSYLRKLEGVQEAIRSGADVNAFRDRESPLVIASELGDDRLVAFLLTVPHIDVNFRNIFGETPLLIAVRNTFNKIVQMLLNHNADVNLSDNMGKSPLHVALFQQRLQMARLLLAYGADYNDWDAFGERPIYTSVVKQPDLECLVLLLNVGASPDYRGFSGTPLLSRAIMNWTSFKIIETLVSYGASVNARDLYSGKTPLHFAAIINDLKVSKFLINRGADPNLKTVFNVTPYEQALSHNSKAVAQFLVSLTQNANFRKLSLLLRKESIQSQLFKEPTVIKPPLKTSPTKTKKKKKKKGKLKC